MSLKTIINSIGSVAPTLARLLPIPGAGIAADIIASALGVKNTPQSIEQALKTDPDALLKIKMAEQQHQLSLQKQLIHAENMRITAINKSMRAESHSEHFLQWAWRPIWGIISAIAFLILTCFVCFLAYQSITGSKPEAISMIPQLVSSFATLFAIPLAILGVASWHRGVEKRLKVGDLSKGK